MGFAREACCRNWRHTGGHLYSDHPMQMPPRTLDQNPEVARAVIQAADVGLLLQLVRLKGLLHSSIAFATRYYVVLTYPLFERDCIPLGVFTRANW